MKKSTYKPPYTITSKILNLTAQISEAITKIELDANFKITPKLRRENHIKTLAGTLEIEGNFLGEDKITAILWESFLIG